MLRLSMGTHQKRHNLRLKNDAKEYGPTSGFRAVAPEGVRLGRDQVLRTEWVAEKATTATYLIRL